MAIIVFFVHYLQVRFFTLAFLWLMFFPVAAFAESNPVPLGPSDNSFYSPPSDLLRGKPGSIVWVRQVLSSPPGLPDASRSYKVIYRSRSVAGKPIFVSGLVDLPPARMPGRQWPIISWGHGTTGMADNCAPSRLYTSGRAGMQIDYTDPLLGGWLAKAYVIARTDYEGLGTPGAHPYLLGDSAGRSMVDMARAARQMDSRVGRRVLLGGHSQGGMSSLFAAQGFRRWAPELHLLGVLAISPGAYIAEQESLAGLQARPHAITAFAWMIWISAARQAGRSPASFIRGYPQVSAMVKQYCLDTLIKIGSGDARPAHSFFRVAPGYSRVLEVMRRSHPAVRSSAPITIFQGGKDSLTLPEDTTALAEELRHKGARVELVWFDQEDHLGTASSPDAVARASGWAEATVAADELWGGITDCAATASIWLDCSAAPFYPMRSWRQPAAG